MQNRMLEDSISRLLLQRLIPDRRPVSMLVALAILAATLALGILAAVLALAILAALVVLATLAFPVTLAIVAVILATVAKFSHSRVFINCRSQ